jgi:hypothetical protein
LPDISKTVNGWFALVAFTNM